MRTRSGNRPRVRYCFVAVKLKVELWILSWIASFMVLPSGSTVMRQMVITSPLRLSLSSIVLSLIFFSETLVVPGSPLYG